jgi:hypothetical protein
VTFTLANGYSGSDQDDPCSPGGWGWGWDQPTGVTRNDLSLLRVRAWSRITIEVPAWTIVNWNGACGQIETGQDGAEVFRAPECWLGGYTAEGSASPPAPAQFLARPGDQVVQLIVTATGTAGRYDARMYARIVGR